MAKKISRKEYDLFLAKDMKNDNTLANLAARWQALKAEDRPSLRTKSYFFSNLPWARDILASELSLTEALSTALGDGLQEDHPALHVSVAYCGRY